jgi:hypothetical protein
MFKIPFFIIVFVSACAIDDTESLSSQSIVGGCSEGIPSAIAPAADQTLAFGLDAVGVQKYACSGAGAWVFVAPEASLSHGNQAFVHHYAGPTWEWLDGSTVVGARLAGATVDASAIPWLLLGAKSHNDVDGKMTGVTAIQRVSTTGGNAPAGSCAAGETADVPYTAVYLFYRTKAEHTENNIRCGV